MIDTTAKRRRILLHFKRRSVHHRDADVLRTRFAVEVATVILTIEASCGGAVILMMVTVRDVGESDK